MIYTLGMESLSEIQIRWKIQSESTLKIWISGLPDPDPYSKMLDPNIEICNFY